MKAPILWLVLIAVTSATSGRSLIVAGEVERSSKKLKVVIFGGHPDDPESGAGGLVALLTRQGDEVILAYGTSYRGDRRFGRPEAEVRREEATAACEALAPSEFLPLRSREAHGRYRSFRDGLQIGSTRSSPTSS